MNIENRPEKIAGCIIKIFKNAFLKIREKGLLWCFGKMLSKSSFLSEILSAPGNIRHKAGKQPDILYAFWDHEVSPSTFDILAFLVLAELERIKCRCKSMCVVIVPGPDSGFRRGELESYNQSRSGGGSYDFDDLRWRLNNIEIPCCWQMPSCRQVMVCASREEAQMLQVSLAKFVFPRGYTVCFRTTVYSLPKIEAIASKGARIPSLQATRQALRFMEDWIRNHAGKRKVIVITLRESLYEQKRNSNLEAWGDFARGLDKSVYYPIVLRDTEVVFKPLPYQLEGLTFFSEASWNTELRCALYELSYLNMFVPNGPLEFCMFNRQARYIVFKSQFYIPIGIAFGSQLKIAGPFQKLVWEDDNPEAIQRSFNEICAVIEENTAQKGRV